MESILSSIKKLLGPGEDLTHYDTDIMIHINSALMTLNQLGVGPVTGLFITGAEETWTSLIGDRKDVEGIKTYIYLKVRLIFDPPTSGFLIDAMERQIREFEWRLNVQVDKLPVEPVSE